MIPFAAVSASGSASVFLLFVRAVASFMKLYLLLLFIRVLLSWFPQFNWDQQPWLTLRQLTDPYLNLFRGLVPPLLGQVDLTPLLGFWILQFLAGMMVRRGGSRGHPGVPVCILERVAMQVACFVHV